MDLLREFQPRCFQDSHPLPVSRLIRALKWGDKGHVSGRTTHYFRL